MCHELHGGVCAHDAPSNKQLRVHVKQLRVNEQCFDTSSHVEPKYDEMRVELQLLFHMWVHHGGSSALHVAQAIK